MTELVIGVVKNLEIVSSVPILLIMSVILAEILNQIRLLAMSVEITSSAHFHLSQSLLPEEFLKKMLQQHQYSNLLMKDTLVALTLKILIVLLITLKVPVLVANTHGFRNLTELVNVRLILVSSLTKKEFANFVTLIIVLNVLTMDSLAMLVSITIRESSEFQVLFQLVTNV
jgi:hypothetical protein